MGLGWGDDGQIGNGTYSSFMQSIIQTTPVKIMKDVVSISTGYAHSMAIKKDNTLWTWGYNYNRQLGRSEDELALYTNIVGDSIIITPVKVLEDVISVSAGEYYSMALKSNGTLWTWGDNKYGQCGNGTSSCIPKPVKVS